MAVAIAAQAQAIHDGADELLKESGLLNLLHRFGEVRLKGAYAYGVMLDPDIDIEVVVPRGSERSSAVAILQGLIDGNEWNGYLFYDHREKRSPRPQHAGVPRAYYIGVKGQRGGHWWEVDIWVGDAVSMPVRDEWVRRGMDEGASREIVLRLKAARREGRISASGLTIYTAVIQDRVATVDQFIAWQEARGSGDLGTEESR